MCLESISFLDKVKEILIMLSLTKKKVAPLPKKQLSPSEKVTPSEEV